MSQSAVGKALLRFTGDRRRAAGLHIIALTCAILLLGIGSQIAWAFLREAALAQPAGTTAMRFWTIELSGMIAILAFFIAGFRRAFAMEVCRDGVCLTTGSRRLKLPSTYIRSVSVISADVFHRHYDRYAQTQRFVNRLHRKLLLMETPEGPVVVGLRPDDLNAVVRKLRELPNSHLASPPSVVPDIRQAVPAPC